MTGSYENTKLLLEKDPVWKIKLEYSREFECNCSFVVSLVAQNIVAVCVSGIVGTENIITSKRVD